MQERLEREAATERAYLAEATRWAALTDEERYVEMRRVEKERETLSTLFAFAGSQRYI